MLETTIGVMFMSLTAIMNTSPISAGGVFEATCNLTGGVFGQASAEYQAVHGKTDVACSYHDFDKA